MTLLKARNYKTGNWPVFSIFIYIQNGWSLSHLSNRNIWYSCILESLFHVWYTSHLRSWNGFIIFYSWSVPSQEVYFGWNIHKCVITQIGIMWRESKRKSTIQCLKLDTDVGWKMRTPLSFLLFEIYSLNKYSKIL